MTGGLAPGDAVRDELPTSARAVASGVGSPGDARDVGPLAGRTGPAGLPGRVPEDNDDLPAGGDLAGRDRRGQRRERAPDGPSS